MRRISTKNVILRAEQQGSVIVELALMLPVLAIFILGATDLGIIIREHQVVQNSAREGARFSAQPKNQIDSSNPTATPEPIRDKVINYLAQENITVTASGDCVLDSTVPQWNCALTNGGNIAIRQQYPIPTVVDGVNITDRGSSVAVTYNRSFLFSGGSLFQFNSVSLTGNSVFHNLY
jgi:Flp pilus assembly protein TadG